MDFDKKIEEAKERLKLIEREYLKCSGRLELLEELKEESEKKETK